MNLGDHKKNSVVVVFLLVVDRKLEVAYGLQSVLEVHKRVLAR